MPPPPPGDSTRKKKKKKKGRPPAHQNTFAFRHNPKSKKTERILSSPNVGVCDRCRDKIEWRKKYRKYKPLTQPAKCNLCSMRNVLAAYHTICGNCARSDGAIDAMEEKRRRAVVVGDVVVERAPTTTTTTTPTTTTSTTTLDDDDDYGTTIAEDGTYDRGSSPAVHSTTDATNAPSAPSSSSSSSIAVAAAARRGWTRTLRVCAMCASEPASSSSSDSLSPDVHPDDVDVVLRSRTGGG
ncbi:hypothetical protein ACHAXA_010948 [Cyclostephanos tholiformis]|uniref:Uncharacterized protein n=1 Tax=Cyclostephanos tholiformis TaxID=382380 RepID=A0ABD3RMH2_9STRA